MATPTVDRGPSKLKTPKEKIPKAEIKRVIFWPRRNCKLNSSFSCGSVRKSFGRPRLSALRLSTVRDLRPWEETLIDFRELTEQQGAGWHACRELWGGRDESVAYHDPLDIATPCANLVRRPDPSNRALLPRSSSRYKVIKQLGDGTYGSVGRRPTGRATRSLPSRR